VLPARRDEPGAPDVSTASRRAAPEERADIVSLYQKQRKIYPRAVTGWFARWRWSMVWATQLVFYGLPWLEWNGRQAVLFDIVARRFYLFGVVLYPQDFIFLTGLLIVCAYALFLFTAVGGRLWCGYACPQTVYTEIFMWIERRLEGDRAARMRLDAAPWKLDKWLRKGGKHLAWLALGLWTGFSFVGYFTPIRSLAQSALQFGLGPWETFWTLFYGFATYGNAGWMREQVCKYMCPYARFQSAMFDRDTLIISYDAERGEPRGARGRGDRPQALGDCVDCRLCVLVCPTGIDIRQGLQYECIACTACIDVCNGMMDKLGCARGLIRYDTQNGLAQHLSRGQRWRRVLRPRVLVYGSILLLILTGIVAGLALRKPFRLDVVRDRGTLARVVEDGWVENVYRLQIMNATERAQRCGVDAAGIEGIAVALRGPAAVGPAEAIWLPVALRVPPGAAASLGPGSHRITFTVHCAADGVPGAAAQVDEQSTFLVPR